jgi:DnaJ-class molecular chaperone
MGYIAGTPLAGLTSEQIEVVIGASDLYETLGVERSADLDGLRRAYTARAKAWHPDLSTDQEQAHEEMIRINQAWEILRNAEMRAAYDWLEANRGGPPR